MTKPIEVFIADDYPIVRVGLRAVVKSASDIVVAGEATSGDEVVEKVYVLLDDDSCDRIDLVFTDLCFGEAPGTATRAGGVDATAITRALAGRGAKAPEMLAVTNYSSGSDVLGAVTVGAVGYLLKDATPEELIDGIRRAVRGGTVPNTQVAGCLMGRTRNPNTALTPRGLKVLGLVARGMSNRKIAEQLVLTEAIAKSHLIHIFTKLDVSFRTAAAARAQELGMLGE